VRLVQRGQRNEFLEIAKNAFSYPDGVRVLHSAVDDAMPHANQAQLIAQPEQERSQMIHRSVVAQLDSFAP
jgi:hypothetical protein